jgi:hypothetical protein
MKKRSRFTCPECGGNTYGTVLGQGSCHGSKGLQMPHNAGWGFVPCTFQWPRAEDWRYFTLVIDAESPADHRVLYALSVSQRPPRVRVHNAGFDVHLSAPTMPEPVLAQAVPKRNLGASGLPPPVTPPHQDGTYIHEDEYRARMLDRESASSLSSESTLPGAAGSEPTLPSQRSPATTSTSSRASSDMDEMD